MNFISTLGFAGTIIDLLRAAPQLVRLLRERKSFGVSVDTSGTSCVVSLGWTTYGIITNQIFVALASGAIASFFFIITVAALRLGRSAREFRVTPLWFIVLFAAVTFFGKTGLGLMLSISALISNVPQIRVAYKEENLSGLSLGTWLLTLSGGLIWLIYGILQKDLTIMVSTIFQSVTSAIIIGLKLFKQRTENTTATRFISD
ncbi:MAG TPA: SemiSWEET family transporter [Anaerolineales bacterium]|nr:SemiSWEET family transporter [Anaerolineales bacterium]HNB39944.1 SemiSWEET family transporter [Anaerolineales bacterium]HNE03058.1 SemiSWEET family transporter [Anaerolineales bacterium]HNH25848.1 SemiSWEET family transporter [Anaerolineales bacterium]HNM37183.1 SemiSWEET family transporter [Anaerolineales bacterium]